MKRLARWHRGGFQESLDTTVEVHGLRDVIEMFSQGWPTDYVKNIRIRDEKILDDRLPKEWNGAEYMVVADICNYKAQCLGYANFYSDDASDNGKPIRLIELGHHLANKEDFEKVINNHLSLFPNDELVNVTEINVTVYGIFKCG